MPPFDTASAIIATAATAVLDRPPSAIPAGFGAIVQMNTRLLHRTLSANLARLNLNPLSARVPYQAELVSPGLHELAQPFLSPMDSVVADAQPYLEVQVLNPVPQTLDWPPALDPPGTSGTTIAAAIPQRKTVTLVWSVTVNLFRPAPPPPVVSGNLSLGDAPATDGGGSTAGGGQGGPFGGVLAPDFVLNIPPPLPAGSRTLLAQGTATMTVPSAVVVNPALYQFRLVLNFEDEQPTHTSDDPVMVEFIHSDLGVSLLNQAIAPLQSQTAMGMSPVIAPAGSLTPNQVAQAQLPALHVRDIVLQDPKGQLVAFCVSLGNDSHGAFSLVTSFLSGHDFAYYVSDRVFSPIMKGLWRANRIHTPIVGDVAVEMPVSEGSDQTGIGRARVQVNLSGTLNEAALTPSTDLALGDPMRVVAQQTVKLLALWDPQDRQITDLGGLAEPTAMPFVVALQMFDKPAAAPLSNTIQPPLSHVLKAMFTPLYFPLIERYGVTKVSGFTSSPLRAVVARWSVPRVVVAGALDNVVAATRL
jgi:hypothetical protein